MEGTETTSAVIEDLGEVHISNLLMHCAFWGWSHAALPRPRDVTHHNPGFIGAACVCHLWGKERKEEAAATKLWPPNPLCSLTAFAGFVALIDVYNSTYSPDWFLERWVKLSPCSLALALALVWELVAKLLLQPQRRVSLPTHQPCEGRHHMLLYIVRSVTLHVNMNTNTLW